MNIVHYPITNTKQVEELYSEKDGVPVKHVCTTEFGNSIVDVFYRDTPHPKFGNRYFAVLFRDNVPYIANADEVEKLTFGLVQNDNGDMEYSRKRSSVLESRWGLNDRRISTWTAICDCVNIAWRATELNFNGVKICRSGFLAHIYSLRRAYANSNRSNRRDNA